MAERPQPSPPPVVMDLPSSVDPILVHLVRAVAAIGLAFSLALLLDYTRAVPTFCDEGGGCEAVRQSSWARPLGIPMPIFGVAFFAAALGLSVVPGRASWTRRALPLVAFSGAAGAIVLLVVQGAVIEAWCELCIGADVSALTLAVLVALLRGRALPAPTGVGVALAGVITAAAIGGPVGWALTRPAPPPEPPPVIEVALAELPEVVAREQRPGEVTIVDFIDFQCPFCRAMHGRLTAAIAATRIPVRIVRKMVPLNNHEGAMPAALAYCCAEAQGKEDAVAEALIAADIETLTSAGCEALAVSHGVEPSAYRACIAAPATRARIDAEKQSAKDAKLASLPTIFIGREKFAGAGAEQPELEASLRRVAAAAGVEPTPAN